MPRRLPLATPVLRTLLLLALVACGGGEDGGAEGEGSKKEAAPEGPFREKGGTWYYLDTPVASAEQLSFTPLDDHYARDKFRAYYADAEGDGTDGAPAPSWTEVIKDADAASFEVIRSGYAKDARRHYFAGKPMAVRDRATFALLDPVGLYSRDTQVAYYRGAEIPGSSGPTFTALTGGYAKDAARVYYGGVRVDEQGTVTNVALPIADADVTTFEVFEDRYARDARRAYFEGAVISTEARSFRALGAGYARTAREVFYAGRRVEGARAATFEVIQDSTTGFKVLARDGLREYSKGEPKP